MRREPSAESDHAPNAIDVVDGEIGSAWLKDPATVGPIEADLNELPAIDLPPEPILEDDENQI